MVDYDMIEAIVEKMRGVKIKDRPHASRGGRAYPKEVREMVIEMMLSGGIATVKSQVVKQLRAQKKFPVLQTCRRWLRQHLMRGHVLPKRKTGNKVATREITGEALVQLALYRVVRPHARLYEVRAYLANRFPNVKPYSNSQICRAEQRLGLSRKAASSTSQEAYSPKNLMKRKMYWEYPYPLGVAGEKTADIIDIDEARFKLESADRSYGKVAREFRCNLKGRYKKGDPGTNLILAISGDDHNPISFHQQFTEGGTDLFRFYCFMSDLIDFLEENYPNRSFLFTMDNLNIHKHPIILNLIEDAGHRIVFRAPYWSCDGSIEYAFNTIHTILEMSGDKMENVDALVNRINLIIGSLGSFRRYFLHVGFQDN
ncbi:hypothetical protein QTG54_013849 [Skeletonema marinoi]|uniref:Tc1-like transposase DDE domain-containing protein n=1 Tax=Skeletonema marinoi TaxID=267567 RepID=A0AAD9D6A3_9STRA|nr:hypothetical protein QTG54_013849 [Skeletonema marinoi]